MGERGNIVTVSNHETPNYLVMYTHWGGYELEKTLRSALNRGRGCWDDDPYLSRIIFSEMIQGEVLGETGYGLTVNNITDNNYPIWFVDHRDMKVYEMSEAKARRAMSQPWREVEKPDGKTFAEFVDLVLVGQP